MQILKYLSYLMLEISHCTFWGFVYLFRQCKCNCFILKQGRQDIFSYEKKKHESLPMPIEEKRYKMHLDKIIMKSRMINFLWGILYRLLCLIYFFLNQSCFQCLRRARSNVVDVVADDITIKIQNLHLFSFTN